MSRIVALTLLAPAGCSLLFEPPSGAGRDASSDAATVTGDGAPDPDAEPPGEDAAPTGFIPLCPSNDLVAHWDFNADPLTTIDDVVGNHPGQVVDHENVIDEIPSIASPRGRAGQFEPVGDVFVKVDDDDALDLTVGSIEVWVRYDTSDGNQQVVARDAEFSGDGHFRIRREEDRIIDVRLQKAGCSQGNTESCTLELFGSDSVPDGKWAQIVVNFGCMDGVTCKVELYVNSVLQASSTDEYSFEGAMNPLVFATDQGNAPEGEATGTPTEYLDGAIDEIVLCKSWVEPKEPSAQHQPR